MEICFDLDDVIKPLVYPYWLDKIEDITGVYLPYDKVKSFWDLNDYLYLLDPKYFNHNQGDPEQGSYELVNRLVCCGHKVYILSATHHNNIPAKANWLLIWGGSKGLVAKSGRILVDDATHNLQDWQNNGGLSIAYTRPWNHDWTGERVAGFQDLDKVFTTWGLI